MLLIKHASMHEGCAIWLEHIRLDVGILMLRYRLPARILFGCQKISSKSLEVQILSCALCISRIANILPFY
jgi:hypothetical protein